MDISLALKTGYYQALSAELGVPVYDAFAIPENAGYPYVIIASINPVEIVTSKCKSYNASVVIDVVTGYSSPTGHNEAFTISGQIENIINPPSRNPIDLRPNGYQIGQTRSSSQNVQLRSNNFWIYRNVITFTHIIWVV